MAVPTPIAIISPVPTPYRVHFHKRIARELNVELHSLFTHDDAVSGPAKWRMEMPPEIGAVFFEGDLLTSNSGDLPRQRRLFKRICAFLVEKKIELVVLDGYADFARLLLLRWAKRRNLPVVLRGDSNIHSETGLPAWKKLLKKQVVGWAIRQAAGLMPMGTCGSAYFDLYGGRNKPAFICPYEPDYAAIEGVTTQQRAAFCEKHRLDPMRKRFLYCGRLVPQKRVDVALDAFAAMADTHPDWDLALAGDGPLRAELTARIPPHLRSRVQFLGFLQMDETAACYRACDCLLLPSDYEPWALVINEACAAGLAIVATEVVGAAVELVQNGDNGHLVPPGNPARFAAAMAQVADADTDWRAHSQARLARWRAKADPVDAVAQAMQAFAPQPGGKKRILFLASYFPKPGNPLMGTWALKQAQALARREDVELLTVSFTSWVPKFLARSSGAKAYAQCPEEHEWTGGVRVLYPRWLYYPIGPIRRWMHKNPAPFMRLAAWSAKRKFQKSCDEFKPDAFFCHHSLPNGWLAMGEAKRLGIPLMITEHDFGEIEDCAKLPARQKAFAAVAHSAGTLIALNRRMDNAMRQVAPKANIQLLYNGVDPPPPGLRQAPKPQALAGKQIILAVALFAERKGIPLLVEAFSKVAPSHPNAILRIVGSGPDEANIRAAIERLNLADRVQMGGRKSPAEVLQEMAWADCFALLGWDEPFATVYLEALAVGTPILCCSDGGICDVVQHGEHGLHVKPKDLDAAAAALAQALENPAELRRMGENGKKLIGERLTWDVNVQELLKLLVVPH